jgi:hypothetical protein
MAACVLNRTQAVFCICSAGFQSYGDCIDRFPAMAGNFVTAAKFATMGGSKYASIACQISLSETRTLSLLKCNW